MIQVSHLTKLYGPRTAVNDLNFDVQNDSIIAGSRSAALTGKILISKKTPEGIETYWESIYPSK